MPSSFLAHGPDAELAAKIFTTPVHSGKLERLKQESGKWEKFWFEIADNVLIYHKIVAGFGTKGFKKGSYTLTRYSSIDVEVHEVTESSFPDDGISALSSSGLSSLPGGNMSGVKSQYMDSETSIAYSIDLNSVHSNSSPNSSPEGTLSDSTNNRFLPRPTTAPIIGRQSSFSMSSLLLLGGGSVQPNSKSNRHAVGPESISKYPGSKYSYQFALKNVINDNNSTVVDDLILSCESLDEKYKWIDVINKIILADSYIVLMTMYSLQDVFLRFNIESEFSIELRFANDFSEVLIPATQYSDDPMMFSMKSLDTDKPTLRFQSSQNGTLGLYDVKSAHMGFYTIIMANTDSWALSEHSEIFIQWAVVNSTVLFDNTFSTHNSLCDYIPPCPSPRSRANRIVLLVFQQPEFLDKSTMRAIQESFPGSRRAKPDLNELASQLELGPLVAVNCFVTEWDPHVDVVRDRFASVFISVDEAMGLGLTGDEDVEFLNGDSSSNIHRSSSSMSRVVHSTHSEHTIRASDSSSKDSNLPPLYPSSVDLLTRSSNGSMSRGSDVNKLGEQPADLRDQTAVTNDSSNSSNSHNNHSGGGSGHYNDINVIDRVPEAASQEEALAFNVIMQSFRQQLQRQSDLHAEEVVTLQHLVSSIQSELLESRQDLDKSNSRVAVLTQEILAIQVDLETEQNKTRELTLIAEGLSQSEAKLRADSQRLEDGFERERQDYENEIVEYCDKVKALQALLEQESDAKESFKSSAIECSAKMEELQLLLNKEMKALNSKYLQLEQELTKQKQETLFTQSQVGERDRMVEELQLEISNLQGRLKEGRRAELDLQSKLNEVEQKLEDALSTSEKRELDFRHQRLEFESEINDLCAKIKTLQASIKEAEGEARDRQAEPLGWVEEKSDLESLLAKAATEIQLSVKLATEKDTEIERLQAEAVLARQTEQETLAMMESLQASLRNNHEAIQRLSVERDLSCEQNEAMCQVFKSEIKTLSVRIDDLQSALDDEAESKEIYKSTAIEYGQQLKQATAKAAEDILSLQHQLSDANIIIANDRETQLLVRNESAEKDEIINLLVEEVEKLRTEVSAYRSLTQQNSN